MVPESKLTGYADEMMVSIKVGGSALNYAYSEGYGSVSLSASRIVITCLGPGLLMNLARQRFFRFS